MDNYNKQLPVRLIGQVNWFNDSKGYGFLHALGSDQDIFVHYTAIIGDGFKTLAEEQLVEFELVEGPKMPQALAVRKLSSDEVRQIESVLEKEAIND